MATVKEIEEALRDARRKQQIKPGWMEFTCGRLSDLDYTSELADQVRRAVERYGASEEDLMGVLKLYNTKSDRRGRLLYEAVLLAADAPDDEITSAADHIDVLRRALSAEPEMDIKYIHFVARVAFELGIPSDRMQRVAEGIASPQDQPDIAEIELQRFVKLMTTHREDWKAAFNGLGFDWEGLGLLIPPCEFELAIAKLDFLVKLELHKVANADTLISALITKPGNNLKCLKLRRNELTVEGFGKLGRDLASQECKVESLRLINTDISKEGWEKAFQHGICNKLVELKLESTGLDKSAEVFFKGLTSPNSSLQTLAIHEEGRCAMEWICRTLEFPKEGIRLSCLRWKEVTEARDTKRLSEALSNPHCELEELAIVPTDQGLGWLGRALQNPNCNLKRLVMRHSRSDESWYCEESNTDACDNNSFWSALPSPHCKLRHLVLRNRLLGDVREMAKAIAECKLESLDLYGFKIENGESFSKALTKCEHLKALTIDDLPWTCILESGIEDLTISSNVERLEDLCQFLGNPKCKLRKFKCFSHIDATDRQLLAALEENYQSCLQELDLHSDSEAVQHRCNQLLERNKIFQNSAFKEFCKPSSAKLFLCGNNRVGKTTITRNLCRRESWFPSHLQRHAPTVGIELQPLLFKSTKQKLVICDLAGRQHFHAFHHYFLRGSEKDLFLIVCKIIKGNVEDFDQSLKYWLRFIASHQSASPKRMPKVLIALNFFTAPRKVDYNPMSRVSSIITGKGYRNVLDLGYDVTEYCFEVVATHVKSLADIKTKLLKGLEDLLSTQPDIPRECLNARTKLIQHASQQQRPKLIPVDIVGEILLPDHSSGGGEAVQSVIKFVLQFLHNCGDAIYFGLGHEEDDIVSRFVILDVQWFMRDVVELFMDSSGLLESRMRTDDVCEKLQDLCPKEPEVVKYTLRILHEMGVILPRDDEWDGSWRHPPRGLIVPALLTEKYCSPALTTHSHHWWGRRFWCKEKELKLLPAGIFAIIQVELHKLCKQGFRLGDGWVAFKDNLVNVIVRVGGDTDRWEDRQFVDVLIFLPQKVENRTRPDLEEEAEEWMAEVRDCIYNSCPSLELEESVLRHGYVLNRISGDDAKPRTWDAVVCGIEVLRNEATARGLDYSHTWSDADESYSWDVTNDINVSAGNTLKRLFMPNEQKFLVKQKVDELCIFLQGCNKFASVYGLSNVEMSEVARLDSFHDPDSFQVRDDKKLAKSIKFEPVGIHWHLDKVEESLEVLYKYLQSVIYKLNDVHKNWSKMMMMKLNVDSPKYPYLTNRDNELKNYKKLVGERLKVHYMCEWSVGRYGQGTGAHEMNNSIGVDLDFAPEWLKRFAPVLKPALILLFIAAKIGGRFAGVGNESKKSIMDFLDSYLPSDKSIKKPKENDVEEIFKLVRRKVGKEEDQITIMAKYFSLHPRAIDDKIVWVCKGHLN